MSFRKASLKHKWKLSLGAYLILLILSNGLLKFSDSESSIIQPINQSKPLVLLFGDPAWGQTELYLGIDNHFQILEWNYNSFNSSHSFENQATKAARYLDSLGVNSVHVIGQGIGDGSAIQFVSSYPEVTKSMTLINPDGLVEYELLGGYHLNRAVYGAKYAFFLTLKHGIPHFGYLKNLDKHILQSKIQYDSDQREIRPRLAGIKIPTLIKYFKDSRPSQEIAREYHRLIPQSVLNVYEDQLSLAGNDLSEFLNNPNNRSLQFSVLRKIQSVLPYDASNNRQAEGNALIILMIVIVLSTLISEDLTCIGTGLMIARGLIGFFPGLFACLFGIFFGDILLYLAGKWLASSTLHKAPLKWFISEKDVERSYHWFEAKGPAIIIASRFIPGTRFPTYFSAGAIGASFWMFILYFGVASILWTPALVGLAVLSGQKMLDYFSLYQDYALWVLLAFLAVAYVLFKVLIPLLTYRGRRVLIGKWKRIINWEFWPLYIVYAPVFVYITGLWFKFRSATLFTLANPRITEGGFIKESKKEILDKIRAKETVAKYEFIQGIDSEDLKRRKVVSFMSENQLDYPIVIKPDVGERGKGVHILKKEAELENFIPELNTDHIMQEFISGEEYGVFYYRYPNEKEGRIFSITKKVYLYLTGDGKHTLEELILKDPRAVCMAELHFDRHVDDLYEIPEEGKLIKLVELGTHARGAIFYDGSNLITPELTKEIDRISQSFEGFYFGRYDVKVSSEEHLKRGEGIKVIEVNGVTSESTNIYDPKHSFFFGIRTLMKQWKIAYEIGNQVKSKHPELKTPSVSHMLSLLR